MANINVTMTVNTVTLGANPNDVPAACTLTDSTGDPSGSTNFEVHAQVGDTVSFNIVASDQTTAVSFSSFAYEGGDQAVLNPLPASDNSWVGTVANEPVGSEESYYIYFNVPSIQGTPFKLDPKIKIDSP